YTPRACQLGRLGNAARDDCVAAENIDVVRHGQRQFGGRSAAKPTSGAPRCHRDVTDATRYCLGDFRWRRRKLNRHRHQLLVKYEWVQLPEPSYAVTKTS